MANRSDFYTAKLPRSIKKMLSLDASTPKHEARAIRKLWIKAHAAHVTSKTRRVDQTVEVGEAIESL